MVNKEREENFRQELERSAVESSAIFRRKKSNAADAISVGNMASSSESSGSINRCVASRRDVLYWVDYLE